MKVVQNKEKNRNLLGLHLAQKKMKLKMNLPLHPSHLINSHPIKSHPIPSLVSLYDSDTQFPTLSLSLMHCRDFGNTTRHPLKKSLQISIFFLILLE